MPINGTPQPTYLSKPGSGKFDTRLKIPAVDAGALFLKTELGVGLAFAWIAIQSRAMGRHEKSNRNQAAARRAYDALLRFRDRVALNASQSAEFDQGFAHLYERLHSLGETI